MPDSLRRAPTYARHEVRRVRSGRVFVVGYFTAAGDAYTAAKACRETCRDAEHQVWCGGRRVYVFPAADPPAAAKEV